ncbi:MAG: hypothetical protein HDR83_05250 [Bacteroides sp.]|nr:hypothetical protein [Bacteroides sp.]
MMRFLSLLIVAAAMLGAACSRTAPAVVYPDREIYPVAGIDISSHNGEVDFDAVKADGYDFVIIKATEGATFKDKAFLDNYNRAIEAGLSVGAYHFFRFETSGYMQGLNFVNSINGRELHLPVAIDIEEWTNSAAQPTSHVLDRLNEMIDHLERHGYRVMLYTNKNGYERFVRGNFPGYPVWLCSLVDPPAEPMRWTLWQATHRGKVAGTDHPVDINAFNGSREEWDKWLQAMQ